MADKFNVLVVDDDPDKRMLLTIALQMAGYEVHTANDGEQGLSAINSFEPDLIITDVMMPNMDGYELARRVRANPLTRFLPIIIQTAARDDAQDLRRGSEVGALGYITDPTDIDLLLARARTLLDFKLYVDTLEETISELKETIDQAGLHLKPKTNFQPESELPLESQQKLSKVTSIIKSKIENCEFDVFLCHNNEDKETVKEIGNLLMEHGIRPWLDEWALRPGRPWQDELEQQIGQIKTAAVFVGKNGIGPWQRRELNAFLREFVSRDCAVIPVLLADAIKKPELPIFLRDMTWVDFRKQMPDPVERLIWGITGELSVI